MSSGASAQVEGERRCVVSRDFWDYYVELVETDATLHQTSKLDGSGHAAEGSLEVGQRVALADYDTGVDVRADRAKADPVERDGVARFRARGGHAVGGTGGQHVRLIIREESDGVLASAELKDGRRQDARLYRVSHDVVDGAGATVRGDGNLLVSGGDA